MKWIFAFLLMASPACADGITFPPAGGVQYLPLTGGTVTGPVTFNGITSFNNLPTFGAGIQYYNGITQLDGQPNNFSGPIIQNAPPTSPIGLTRGTEYSNANNVCLTP